MIEKVAHTSSEPIRESVHLDSIDTAVVSEQQARELDRRIAREQTEALLDEALGETFPASDPIAITSRKRNPQ